MRNVSLNLAPGEHPPDENQYYHIGFQCPENGVACVVEIDFDADGVTDFFLNESWEEYMERIHDPELAKYKESFEKAEEWCNKNSGREFNNFKEFRAFLKNDLYIDDID